MRVVTLLLLTGLLSSEVNGQNCNCPKSSTVANTGLPGRIFTTSYNRSLAICGSFSGDTVSEFCLYECGNTKPIDEWDATQNCVVTKIKDGVRIAELFGAPVGTNFTIMWQPFYTTDYLADPKLIKKKISFQIAHKYTKQEITEALKRSAHLSKPIDFDQMLHTSRILFWAYISGSVEAEKQLNTFQNRFGPFDGAIEEEWKEIYGMYELWKQQHPQATSGR